LKKIIPNLNSLNNTTSVASTLATANNLSSSSSSLISFTSNNNNVIIKNGTILKVYTFHTLKVNLKIELT